MIPPTARTVTRNKEQEIPTANLAIDQLLLVKPDEYFPADGLIQEGSTSVDERMITGTETTEKFPSSRVYAGTKNLTGRVVVRVSAVGDDVIVRKIEKFTHLQINTDAKPSTKERLFGAAAKLLRKQHTSVNQKARALADKSIFIAGAETYKKLQKIDTIVFDKTGIITTGMKHVVHVISFKPYTQQQVLNTAAAIESKSNHLTAHSIVNFARSHGAAALQDVSDFKEEGGVGVSGTVNGRHVLVGPAALLSRKKIKMPPEALEHKQEGETVVYIVIEKDVIGYIALTNPVKKNAKEVMTELKKHYRVVLMSGEHEDTVVAIAKQAAMNEVVADVREGNREEKLAELRSGKRGLAYVTALHPTKSADIMITMGTRSAFSGDVSILHGNLESIQTLFDEVRKK